MESQARGEGADRNRRRADHGFLCRRNWRGLQGEGVGIENPTGRVNVQGVEIQLGEMKTAQPFQHAEAGRFGQVGQALPEASRWEVLRLPNAAGMKLSCGGAGGLCAKADFAMPKQMAVTKPKTSNIRWQTVVKQRQDKRKRCRRKWVVTACHPVTSTDSV